MRKSIKKSISLFLAAVMLVVGLPVVGLTFEARADGSSGGKYYENGYYYDIEEPDEPGGDNYAVITEYNGLIIDGKLEIPSELGGYSVKTIRWGAFTDCTELISVTIPDSVTSIGDAAFRGCAKLTSIVIPDSVMSFGQGAFEDCTELTSVTISAGVTSIGDGAFIGCSAVEKINVDKDNPIYHSDGNCLIKTGDKELIFGCKNSVIPSDGSVTIISEEAFMNCTSLKSVMIPNNVTKIDGRVFYGCTGLKSVTISSSVIEIENSAFEGCYALENIEVENGNPVYHSAGNCLILTDDEELVLGCNNSVIPADGSVSAIGISAFEGRTGLTDIKIPDSVTEIGWHAFYGCTGLTSISIPCDVFDIRAGAFGGCSALEKIEVEDDNPVYHSDGNCLIQTDSEELILGCKNSIIPSDGSVTSIGSNAFQDCSELKIVIIPESVTVIENGAFENCTSLISIAIPDSVTNIGYEAFKGCTGLMSVTLGNGLTNIEGRTFEACTGLKSISISSSVQEIPRGAFSDCTALEKIKVEKGNQVYHSDGNCLIKTDSKELFLGCKKSVIPSDGSIASIGMYAFSGCTGLTSIAIPDSVTSIGYGAFSGCTGLTSVTIGNSVTSIGEFAFDSCIGLTSIAIPGSVISIDWSAFRNCTGLTSVAIAYGVTKISNVAFSDCINLKSIAIPDSVTDIGYGAFGYYYDNNKKNMVKLPDFTIYGYTDSAAETYANENGFKFVTLDEEHTHTFSAWMVTTEATCTAEGVETRKCSVCEAEETRKIAKKDHDISHVEEKSTCVVAGVSYDICGECGETFNYTVLPLADHAFSAWTVTKEPTVFEVGEKQRSCTVCGFTEKSEIEKLRAIEKKDDKTGVSVICSDKSYDGDVEISVTEIFDGTSYHILNTEKGNFQKQLFDIATMVDGKKVQPNDSVFVKIPLPAKYNAQKTVVYYITNDGQLEKIESKVEDGYIIFETTHFSFYAIVDEKTPDTKNCSCKCHKTGFLKFIFKIQLLFQKLFKLNKVCKCGIEHY